MRSDVTVDHAFDGCRPVTEVVKVNSGPSNSSATTATSNFWLLAGMTGVVSLMPVT